jgi:hypothetical protein
LAALNDGLRLARYSVSRYSITHLAGTNSIVRASCFLTRYHSSLMNRKREKACTSLQKYPSNTSHSNQMHRHSENILKHSYRFCSRIGPQFWQTQHTLGALIPRPSCPDSSAYNVQIHHDELSAAGLMTMKFSISAVPSAIAAIYSTCQLNHILTHLLARSSPVKHSPGSQHTSSQYHTNNTPLAANPAASLSIHTRSAGPA